MSCHLAPIKDCAPSSCTVAKLMPPVSFLKKKKRHTHRTPSSHPVAVARENPQANHRLRIKERPVLRESAAAEICYWKAPPPPSIQRHQSVARARPSSIAWSAKKLFYASARPTQFIFFFEILNGFTVVRWILKLKLFFNDVSRPKRFFFKFRWIIHFKCS